MKKLKPGGLHRGEGWKDALRRTLTLSVGEELVSKHAHRHLTRTLSGYSTTPGYWYTVARRRCHPHVLIVHQPIVFIPRHISHWQFLYNNEWRGLKLFNVSSDTFITWLTLRKIQHYLLG
jgi:hypothetical protein